MTTRVQGMMEALIVSDSRFKNTRLRRTPEWTLRAVSKPGLRMTQLVKLVQKSLRPSTRLLIIAALHCDLTYRMKRPNGQMGLLRSHRKNAVSDIFNKISAYTYSWQQNQDLSIIWCLPAAANMVRYNEFLANQRNQYNLNQLQTEEWFADSKTMTKNISYLQECFDRRQEIPYFDLMEFGCNLFAEGSDGVHLEDSNQEEVLNSVVAAAISRYPCAPMTKTVKNLIPTRKMAVTNRRRRYRQILAARRSTAGIVNPQQSNESQPGPSRESRSAEELEELRPHSRRAARHESEGTENWYGSDGSNNRRYERRSPSFVHTRERYNPEEAVPSRFHGRLPRHIREHREDSRRTRHVVTPNSSGRYREVYDPNMACPSRFHGRLQGRPHAHRSEERAGPSHRGNHQYDRDIRHYVQEGRVKKHGRPRC